MIFMRKKSVGSVQVALRNEGPDAFQPETFGDTIIIERKLSKEGQSSGYRILNERSMLDLIFITVFLIVIVIKQTRLFPTNDSS